MDQGRSAEIPQPIHSLVATLGSVVQGTLGRFLRIVKYGFTEKGIRLYFASLVLILLLGIVGPTLAPYDYDKPMYSDDGEFLRASPPTIDHPLGTTSTGFDVLSRLLVGAQPTVFTGFLAGIILISISLFIGVTAGYMGGTVDEILMRFTDLMYGVPLIPFAIVLLALLGFGFISTVLVIGLLLWRSSARVIRSQVLQIKERPYIHASIADGASTPRIIYKHILPGVAPMAILYFSLGVGIAILLQASLAFIGLSNPFQPSWGIMIRNAFRSGEMISYWWWTLPPGIMISMTVLSAIMLGRKYEATDQGDDEYLPEI